MLKVSCLQKFRPRSLCGQWRLVFSWIADKVGDLHVQQCNYFWCVRELVDDGRCCRFQTLAFCVTWQFQLSWWSSCSSVSYQNHRRISLSVTFQRQEKWRSYLQKPAQEVKLKVHAASQLWSWKVLNPGVFEQFWKFHDWTWMFLVFIFSTDIIRIAFTFLYLHVKTIRSWNGMFWGLWRRDAYAKGLGLPSVVITRGSTGSTCRVLRQESKLLRFHPNQQSYQSNGSNVSKRSMQIEFLSSCLSEAYATSQVGSVCIEEAVFRWSEAAQDLGKICFRHVFETEDEDRQNGEHVVHCAVSSVNGHCRQKWT